ncbi:MULTISPECIES: hypothetical protein [unclassified Streptomyces]|uniref:hypothetical protein n=1 Tax=unclassified Streptomyces TaxID=2593676 RepID=UPI00403C4E6A
MSVGLSLGIFAALAGAAAGLVVPDAGLPPAFAATQLLSGAAGGLAVSPNQTQVPQHAPAQAAGVGGGILQMAQRITAAVCLSAVSAVSLHTATASPRARLHAGLLRLRGSAGRSPGAVTSAAGGHLVTRVGVRVRGGTSCRQPPCAGGALTRGGHPGPVVRDEPVPRRLPPGVR